MSEPLLEMRDLTVRFGGLVAVNSVSLSIPRAEIHGVIGPNGAGKTSFFNAISGLVPISAGSIALGSVDITRMPPHQRAQMGLRRTFQSVQLIEQFTVLENVMIGLHHQISDRPGRFFAVADAQKMSESNAQDRVVEVLEFLGIGHTLFKRPKELSFAEQRYVEFARALAGRPSVLMLDEPVAGLSPSEVGAINALIRKLRKEWGMTIVLVEHVLSLVLNVSDRVTVLVNGSIIASDSPEGVASNPAVQAAYLGDEHA